MKPPPFEYVRAGSVEEAVGLLSQHRDDAKIVAGGQTLMPMLAFRMLAPKVLVDIGRIEALRRITIDSHGVTLGALTRWRDIERCKELLEAHPLLADAITHVAHYQIRNRGTVGGSIVHADPAAEFPGIAVVCGAEIEVVGPKGKRVIAANDFLLGSLTTALSVDEIVVAIRLPAWKRGRSWAFEEFARRRGDFALAGVALFYDLKDGRAVAPRIGAIGVDTRAIRIEAAEERLAGKKVDAVTIREVAAVALESINPEDDIHAPGDYRRALLGVLLERALMRAAGLEQVEFT